MWNLNKTRYKRCSQRIFWSPRYTFPNNRGGPRISREPIGIFGVLFGFVVTLSRKSPMVLRVPCSVDPESPRITPDSTRFNYESAQNVPRTRQECDRWNLNRVCLSQMSPDKNVPRLLPRLTPVSSSCTYLPSEPRLRADLPDSATNHPERVPVSPDSATEEPRIMPNQLNSAWFGDWPELPSSRSAQNHQESSRLTTNLPRFTPNHTDYATTHPDSPRLTIRSSFGSRFGNV